MESFGAYGQSATTLFDKLITDAETFGESFVSPNFACASIRLYWLQRISITLQSSYAKMILSMYSRSVRSSNRIPL